MTSTRSAHEERVAVIGTGAIGTAVARALLAGGREVAVWNRTRDRTTAAVEAGARAAASAAEAVGDSTLALLTLKDYRGVHEVLDQMTGDLSGHTVAVLCTGTPADARRTAERVVGLRAAYMDVGVQAAPEMIGTEAATLLYAGSAEAFERHRDTLRLLSEARFVGRAPEAAAVWDLALFGLWYDAQLGVLRALDVARAAGLDLQEFADTARIQLGHVVDAVPGTVSEVLTSAFPAGPASLDEHLPVVRQLIELRSSSPLGDGGLVPVTDLIAALTEAGRGHEGLTATLDRKGTPQPPQEARTGE
jgi:3-hydroxyisobutyrate dehydrogenase-like beta-hydroxyacid dehydrogenase